MRKIIGICNLHDGPHLGKLTEHRPLGTVTVLGRYGLMDFALSNFSNCDIDKVLILVEDHVEAVRNHTGNGQVWITNTKTGVQKLLFNEKGVSSPRLNTDINNILTNEYAIREMSGDYVVIAPPFFMIKCDYRELVEKHVASGNDISVLYTKVSNNIEDFRNCDVLNIKNGLVNSVSVNNCDKARANISLETFILSKEHLLELVHMGKSVSAIYTLRKMISYVAENGIMSVNPIEYKGESLLPFLSFNGYVKNSMKFLSPEEAQRFFQGRSDVYTTVHSTVPVSYGPNAEVRNSYIANGCKIDGVVENSILSREVTVEKGAVVRNCILFTRTRVASGVVLENVVTDKRADIRQEKDVAGEPDDFLYIEYGAKI